MKTLLVLSFLLISCADNNKSSRSTQLSLITMPSIEEITQLISLSNDQSPIEEVVQLPVEEVIEKPYTQTGSDSLFDYIPKELATRPNPDYTNSYDLFWLEGDTFYYDGRFMETSAWDIYYQPISNRYYLATTTLTNQVTIDLNAPDELMYIEYINWTNRLRYVGSYNFTNRIYIDAQSNQYIKHLTLIPDSTYFTDEYINNKRTSVEKSLESPVYPYARHYDGDGGDIYMGLRYHNGVNDFVRTSWKDGILYETCGG